MRRTVSIITLFILLFSTSTFAQLEIGASYELREEEPQHGFGLRIQKGFLEQLPLIDLGLRAHFSYFSAENSASEAGITYSRDLTNYDFGLAFIGGVNVGLMQPYIGLGLGSETVDIKPEDIGGVNISEEDRNESNIYWNAIVGAKVTVIPLIKPFIEYRYSNNSLSDPEVAKLSTGRIMFGVALSF